MTTEFPTPDYAEEGRNLIRQIERSGARHEQFSPILQHQSGATLFCGGQQLAMSKEDLLKLDLTKIVCCQDKDGAPYHIDDPRFEYLVFPISAISRDVRISRNPTLLAGAMAKLLTFVERNLSDGRSVYIHCLAGAHRAGTATVSSVMHLTGMSCADALAYCKLRRPVINPIGNFAPLLETLEMARCQALVGPGSNPASLPVPSLGTRPTLRKSSDTSTESHPIPARLPGTVPPRIAARLGARLQTGVRKPGT